MNPSSKNFSQRHSGKNTYTTKIICYRSICTGRREEITQMTINKERLKKQWYSHTMEYYAAVERNVNHLYIMLCSDFQDKLYIKRSKIKYVYYNDIYLRN